MTGKNRKTRVTLTERQLEHLFWAMDHICSGGSDNVLDEEVVILLARAMSRRGLNCVGVDGWLKGDRKSSSLETS